MEARDYFDKCSLLQIQKMTRPTILPETIQN